MSDAPVGLARLCDPNREIRPILLRCKLAADYPRAADNKLAAMQRVLSWARDRGITGHTIASVHKILETYLARTRDLPRSAIVKLNSHRRNIG